MTRVTIYDASLATLVPIRTITRWVDLGRITSDYPHGPTGPAYVNLDEIEQLADIRDTRAGKRLPSLPKAS